jgi:hypothetical protein
MHGFRNVGLWEDEIEDYGMVYEIGGPGLR